MCQTAYHFMCDFYIKISSPEAGRAVLFCSESLEEREQEKSALILPSSLLCLRRYAEIDKKSNAVIPPPKELCFRDIGPLSVIDNA